MEFVSRSAGETKAFAKKFAHKLKPGDVLAFFGDLGAGKTTFIQGLAEGLGIKNYVDSPSFIIVNEYPGKIPLYHIDLYRLSGEQEIEYLGIEEYFNKKGIVAIEWAEHMIDLLPDDKIEIRITNISEEERKIIVMGKKRKGNRLCLY